MDEMEYIAALDFLPELCASYLARNFVCSQLTLNFFAQSDYVLKSVVLCTHTLVSVCQLIFFSSYDLTFEN